MTVFRFRYHFLILAIILASIALHVSPAGIVDVTTVLPEPALSLPTPGAAYNDPTFGTQTIRLMDAKARGLGKAIPEYSNLQPWNANMTSLLLTTNAGHSIVDASTLATKAMLDTGPIAVRWSPVDPDILFDLKSGSNSLYRYSVSAKTETAWCTFPEYTRFLRDQSYEEMSNDGRLIALVGVRPDGVYEIFVYDVVNKVKHRPLPTSDVGLNWVAMAPSGRYVVVLWGTNGYIRLRGVEAFDIEMNYAGHVHSAHGHADLTMDSDGKDYLIVEAGNDAYGPFPGNMLVKARVPDGITYDASGQPDWTTSIANGGQTALLQMNAKNDGTFGIHASGRNTRLHGTPNQWAIISTDVAIDPTSKPWIPLQGEIFRVYLDSRNTAPHVERLAHHRSSIMTFASDGCTNPDLYWAQPHATVSPDGTKVLFGSNWHRVCDLTNPVDPFVLSLSGSPNPPPQPPPSGSLANLPNNTWIKLSPTFSPSGWSGLQARSYSGMAWDDKDGLLIDFGGGHGSYLGNDVDLFNPSVTTWTQAYPPEFAPYVSGGSTSTDPYTALTNGTLPIPSAVQANTPTGKPWCAHTYQAMAFNNNGVMLYIDLRLTTWTYTPSGGWVKMSPSATPTAWDSLGNSLVYCPDIDTFVLFTPGGQTWTYKYTGSLTAPWTQITGTGPSSRQHHAMAYDSVNHKVVLFGGDSGGDRNDTWLFDTISKGWTNAMPSGQIPPPREAHGLAYDSKNGVVIAYGGRFVSGNTVTLLDDMYMYQVASNTWLQVQQPALRPSAAGNGLIFGGFVYSPKYNVFFLKNDANGYIRPSGDQSYALTDTWAYRYRTAPGSTPRAPTGVIIK